MTRNKNTFPAELAAEFAKRWQAGERLPALGRAASEQLKRHVAPVTVRGWIVKHFGDGFAAAAKARDEAHPRTQPKAPKAPREPRVIVPVVIDDTGVPVITSTPLNKGWSIKMVRVRGYNEDVLINPEGQRFVRALDSERADLIVDLTHKGIGRVRLRNEETSRLGRRIRKEKKLVAKGEAQFHQRRKTRKARRVA